LQPYRICPVEGATTAVDLEKITQFTRTSFALFTIFYQLPLLTAEPDFHLVRLAIMSNRSYTCFNALSDLDIV
jgi:Sec-independent protein secretion pathway component TatC